MPETKPKTAENVICHVGLFLDASYSMFGRRAELIQVVDNQVAHLAERSKELGIETRITIISYSDLHEIYCLIFDMDVLRLPSIENLYHVTGMTALVPATIKGITELKETAQRYGKHYFVIYNFSDGGGNIQNHRAPELKQLITSLPPNWTVAALTPNEECSDQAAELGFPRENIAEWSTTDPHGVTQVGQVIRDSSNTFMTNASRGITTPRLFSTGATNVNAATVKVLVPLDPAKYELLPVGFQREIREFVEANGRTYVPGTCYYQLNKSEEISKVKKLLVQEVATGKIFGPDGVRELIGLGNETRRVKPTFNPDYVIFPQSSSMNRHLMPNTNLLRML